MNAIQRSCGFSSQQEKPQKFQNQHFHIVSLICHNSQKQTTTSLGDRIKMKQIVQFTVCKNKPLVLGECFKQTPCYKWLPSKICCRYAETALKNMQHVLYCRCWNYTLKLQVPTEAKNFLLIIPTNAFRLNKKPDRFKNDAWCFKPVELGLLPSKNLYVITTSLLAKV